MEQYLSVKNVAKYFGKFQALNNINFDVNEGESLFVFLGLQDVVKQPFYV